MDGSDGSRTPSGSTTPSMNGSKALAIRPTSFISAYTRGDRPESPAVNRTVDSPTVTLKRRYQINEEILPETKTVYGFDRLSHPVNKRVAIHVYRTEADFQRAVGIFQDLRSVYLTPILDKWDELVDAVADDVDSRAPSALRRRVAVRLWFICVERGSLLLSEQLYNARKNFDERSTRDILGNIILLWSFLYDQKYNMQLKLSDFMCYGDEKSWKLYTVTSIGLGRKAVTNKAYVEREFASLILNSEFTHLAPIVDHDRDFDVSLGSVLLEFLHWSPLFSDKSADEVYQIINVQDLCQRLQAEDHLTPIEISTVSLMQTTLIPPEKESHAFRITTETLNQIVDVVTFTLTSLKEPVQKSGLKSAGRDRKLARFLPTIL